MQTEPSPEILRLTFRKPAFWSGTLLLTVAVCAIASLSLVRGDGQVNLLWTGSLAVLCLAMVLVRALRLPRFVPPIELGANRFAMPTAADSRRAVELDYSDLRALSLRQRGSQQILVIETPRGLFMFPAAAFTDPNAIERFFVGLRERLQTLPNGTDVLDVMARREELIRGVLALRPTVTYVILGSLLLGLAAQVFLGALVDEGDIIKISTLGANVPELVRAGEWWRLVTASFLHGSFLHIFVNGLSLIVVGQIVERIIGPWRLGIVYVVACAGGALASAVLGNGAVSVGASTGIFGIFGALAVCNFHYRRELALGFKQPLELWAFNILLNLLLPFIFPFIDLWGHFGGLVAGALMTYVLVAPHEQLIYNRPAGGVVKAAGVLTAVVVSACLGFATRSALTLTDERVLVLAEQSTDSTWMNAVAWEVARRPDASADNITRATRVAKRALEHSTGVGEVGQVRDTYATLLYRAGAFDEALDSEDKALREASVFAEAIQQPIDIVLGAQLGRFLDARYKKQGVRAVGFDASQLHVNIVGQGVRIQLDAPAPKGLVAYGLLKRGSAREGIVRVTLGPDRAAEREHTIPLGAAVVRGSDLMRNPQGLEVVIAWVDANDCRCDASSYEVRFWPHDTSIDGYP